MLLTSQGVNVRVTPDQNPPAAPPYMHAKTMIVDGRVAYLGSIDLDTTEATQDRELGIIFRQRPLVAQLSAQFQADWSTCRRQAWRNPHGGAICRISSTIHGPNHRGVTTTDTSRAGRSGHAFPCLDLPHGIR